MKATVVKLIQIYANNIVFTLKITLFLYQIAINFLLSPFLMLFFHPYKIFFFNFSCFLKYINVYPKYCQSYKIISLSMKSKTLCLKTIIKELDFLKKAVIIQ